MMSKLVFPKHIKYLMLSVVTISFVYVLFYNITHTKQSNETIDSKIISQQASQDYLITYSEIPWLNDEFTINIEEPRLKEKSSIFTWRVVEEPKGSQLKLLLSKDMRQVTVIAKLAGDYKIQVTDAKGRSIETEFSISKVFPFDVNKLGDYNASKDISEISAVVLNQFWVYSNTLSESELRTIVSKYKDVKIIGYDDIEGLLIEGDNHNKDMNNTLLKISTEKDIDSVDKRIYQGRNFMYSPTLIPNDGSDFDDHGDNWHLEQIEMPEAWDISTGENSFYIGVCDSGNYDIHHEDLKGRFKEAISSPHDKDADHGTMVSGVIAATANNNIGVTGINWNTKVIATVSVYGGLNRLMKKNNVLLVNNSWGLLWEGFYDFTPLKKNMREKRLNYAFNQTRRLRKITDHFHDKLFIWSAGNGVKEHIGYTTTTYGVEGKYHTPTIHYDGSKSLNKKNNVLMVAAMRKDEKLVHYSNYGELVDIAAPTSFKSTTINNRYTTSRNYGINGGFNGTSAAAPVVTGVASLIYSIDKRFKASDVKKILLQSATEYVEERYVDPAEYRTERLEHKIPILNAKSALQMAKGIKNGKLKIDPITGEIKLVKRNIRLELSTSISSMTLDELAMAEPMTVSIFANEIELAADEYKKFQLSINVEGVGYTLGYDHKHRRTIQFHSNPIWCLNSVKEVVIAVSVKQGSLANDQGSTTKHITITDMSWEDKCKALLDDAAIMIILGLYLFGLIYKGKFCRNQRIEGVIKTYGGNKKMPKRRLKTFVPWWQKFIPYKAEWIEYQGMLIIADRRCNAVNLSRETQVGITIEMDEIPNAGNQNVKIHSGSFMTKKNEEYFLS